MTLDDSSPYQIGGEAITLGTGGLIARPESEAAGSPALSVPITLGSSQTWQLAGAGREKVEHDMFTLAGSVQSAPGSPESAALTVDASDGIGLSLIAGAETGPLTLGGDPTSRYRIENGVVKLDGGSLNGQDGQPVSVSYVYLSGGGQLGALRSSGATLAVGAGRSPAGDLEAASVTLDPETAVLFELLSGSATPGIDYGQLLSRGPVALGSAVLDVFMPAIGSQLCQAPPIGQTYTLISAPELTGSFANAPEGAQIPIEFANGCGVQPAEGMRIEYHRSATAGTVTGTVVAATAGPSSTAQTINGSGAPAGPPSALAHTAIVEAGRLALAGASIAVQGNTARLRLACRGAVRCHDRLTLSAKPAHRANSAGRIGRPVRIGAASLAAAPGRTVTVKIRLNAAGRALLDSAHGRLGARLTIVALGPGPARAQSRNVRLVRRVRSGAHQ